MTEAGVRSVEIVLVLVVLATVVAAFAQRWRVPPPSLLVVAGVLAGLLPHIPKIQITPDIISLVVLPPLLFAAGEDLSWPQLRRAWRPVVVLAVGLVLASAGAVAAVARLVTPLPLSMAFLLGAVLASTDPVAVTALGRRLALPPQMQTLVQAESLFNDATSLILFRISVVAAVAGGSLTVGGTASRFAILAGGGLAAGAVVAAVVGFIRGHTEDPVVETVITLATPYGAYVLAESVHASGVTAVVTASVILGVFASRLSAPATRLHTAAVQGTVVFVLESVVFGLIGLALPDLIRRLSVAGQPWLLGSLMITATLLLARIAWIFPLVAFRRWRQDDSASLRVAWRVPAVLSWAGARGVVPLAAALSIPLTGAAGAPVPFRDLVQVIATAVIVISLVVQGFTLAPLVRLTELAIAPDDERAELARVRLRLAETGVDYVQEQLELEAVAPVVAERVQRSLQTRLDLAEATTAGGSVEADYHGLRRAVVLVQRAELERLHDEGTASESTRRKVERQLDLEDARYREES
jgi:Na+/H+ antiporter